jgi:hypothetical protein
MEPESGNTRGVSNCKKKIYVPIFGIAANPNRCFDVFLPSKMTDSIASGRCGRPKPVVLFLIQFLVKSKTYDEKHTVNRPSISIVDLE